MKSQPPAELKTKAQIIEYLMSFDLFANNEYEGYAYVHDAIERFLITVEMVPPAAGSGARLLELGANPYFLTLLLKKFHRYHISLANYFGPGEKRTQAEQTIHSKSSGETHTFQYDHFNIEYDDFPYEDNSFDGVLFCEILEHLTHNPTHTLTEIHRVLKPGGFVVVTTPNMLRWEHLWNLALGRNINDLYSGHGIYGRHNREYAPDEVIRLLCDCGFAVQKLRLANIYQGHLLQSLVSTVRAHWKEHIFALAQAAALPSYRYKPWLYVSAGSLRRVTSNVVVIGENDELHTGVGWHPADQISDRPEFVRWTQQSAEVFLRARGGENALGVEINTGLAALGPVEVTLRSDGVAATFTPPPGAWVPLRLPIAPRSSGEEVKLLLDVDHLRCPVVQGAANDARSLGVMVRRVALEQITNRFIMGANDAPHIGTGWYGLDNIPEALRWTQQTAQVFLQAEGGESQILVEVSAGPPALGPVQVSLRCGEHSASYRLEEDGWTPLLLALPPCAAGAEVLLTIEVDHLRSPAEAGLSGDTRGLGVMVRRVVLGKADS